MYIEILVFLLYVIGMSPFMTKCDSVLRIAANEYSVSQTQVIIESSKAWITPTSVLLSHHIGCCWVSHLSMIISSDLIGSVFIVGVHVSILR